MPQCSSPLCSSSRSSSMGAHCCRQDAPLLPGEPTDLDSPRFGDGPSLIPPFGVEDGNDAHDSGSEDDIPQLPVGGRFTVMMFGMTGAGKSAIGNLMAGCEAFASGDDTASVTNLDSVSWLLLSHVLL